MVSLHSHGVGASRVMRVYHRNDAVQVMSELLELPQDLPAVRTGSNWPTAPWWPAGLARLTASRQKAAVTLALAPKALVIAGGPGVGKTTIVNPILRPQQFLNPDGVDGRNWRGVGIRAQLVGDTRIRLLRLWYQRRHDDRPSQQRLRECEQFQGHNSSSRCWRKLSFLRCWSE